jgi:hypothetical protein
VKNKGTSRPQGQLRRSQLVTTFGPGAMLDLPNQSVILGGLEFWGDPSRDGFQPIREDRLLEKARALLERKELRMYSPPVDADEEARTGIGAPLFPGWFVVQNEENGPHGGRARRLVPGRMLQKGKFVAADRKKYPVVPVRFVQACLNGHISDIDWRGFIHEYKGSCMQPLWLWERGSSGDMVDIFAGCDCKKSRSLAQLLSRDQGGSPLGLCQGQRPWLGKNTEEECKGPEDRPLPNRLLVRSASNAYFPQVLSVISIPERDEDLRKAVDRVWEDFLQFAEDPGDLRKERKRPKVKDALESFDDGEVWEEIARRKAGTAPEDKSIKEAEIETLLAQKASVGSDVPDGDFHAKMLPLPADRQGPMRLVDRVILVHRLREVTAQIGFTRFEAEMPDIDGELSLAVRRASLSREASWIPAVENRGEGVLLSFSEEAMDAWFKRPRVKARVAALEEGFEAWKKANPRSHLKFPGPRYILLHSLSHLLITAVSLACGYAASSIRERIYVTRAGSGILLYTGTPDAEGTLGGLIEVGRSIETHLRAALEYGTLCSNDPVCAQHRPQDRHVERFLHGASCHGCLLIAEPSCERRNEFLDRALVVPTVEGYEAEFFGEEEL